VELLVSRHAAREESLPSWCSEQLRQQAQRLPEDGWQGYRAWRPVPNFQDEFFAWAAADALRAGLPAACCLLGSVARRGTAGGAGACAAAG
jgi:hypothetical protein